MQRRYQAQNYLYFGLLLTGLLLSAMSRRIEPLCMVLPLACALVCSRLARPVPVLDINVAITPIQAFEGDPITVCVHLRAETDIPPMEFWHPLPPEATCTAGASRHLVTLARGEEKTFEHQVTFIRRGEYTLGRLYTRIHPNVGLQPLLAEHLDEQTCRIYPQMLPLSRLMPPWHTHISFGHYVARAAGEGVEFAGIRPYNSGDRIRRIHWPTSLKQQQLYVNEYYREHNADVILLLDTLMAAGHPHRGTTLDISVRAAASLASYYLRQKDRVGLVSYGGVCTWLQPSSGQQQWYRILDALLAARTHFSYHSKDITLIPPRVLPPGALIFVLTSLLDRRIEAALNDLVARSFQLVMVVVSPVYAMGSRHFEGESRLWRLETEANLHKFHSLGVPIILQDTEDPLAHLHEALTRRQVWQRGKSL
ncbi:MAG: hypothetical protein ETSY1_26040 [Candidatus Entotheonella factor]|uniref:DUF58 domain-containing protein n=1 Tax=Entotheonella factor TaxID=1429438 RepID=W4LF04_ENTF1|nr:MAG: hypothetical protein ETSY1_26040 [Candidatus Entotheonella factor]